MVRRSPLSPAPSELRDYKLCTQLRGKGERGLGFLFLWKGIGIIWANNHGCDMPVPSALILQVQFVRTCCRQWEVLPSLPWAPEQPFTASLSPFNLLLILKSFFVNLPLLEAEFSLLPHSLSVPAPSSERAPFLCLFF